MKTTVFITVATAIVAVASALPATVSKSSPSPKGFSVSLTYNKNFKPDTRSELQRLNQRYPTLKLSQNFPFLDQPRNAVGTSGSVPVTNHARDLEYYGTINVGTPGQAITVNFDTGSSDIWFPSTECTLAVCKQHTQFDPKRSSTFKGDGRPWEITYGDGSSASGILASDMVNVGGISIRQTVGLSTAESDDFKTSPEDGMFGLGFNSIQSVEGVQTFMDNVIAAGLLALPVVSVFLPAVRVNGGVGGEYLFGAINEKHYTGQLTYVPISEPGYWQVAIDDVAANGKSLGKTSQGIIDTGTTLVMLDTNTTAAIHAGVPGAVMGDQGWEVPCALPQTEPAGKVSFKMGDKYFDIPYADLAYQPTGDGLCFSGVQPGADDLWILGDVFIKNNYCVFDQGQSRIGIAPIKY
ncbi:hypothetical protein BGZ73_003724 [Actinomortierella ambigua]|nr:hypothetical protein BGZ73_003724 [Actinomortierella ambigua]